MRRPTSLGRLPVGPKPGGRREKTQISVLHMADSLPNIIRVASYFQISAFISALSRALFLAVKMSHGIHWLKHGWVHYAGSQKKQRAHESSSQWIMSSMLVGHYSLAKNIADWPFRGRFHDGGLSIFTAEFRHSP